MNHLEMIGICKHFGGVQALKDVELKAKKGEIHALMGENGAGKTTLIRVLAGAHRADAGEIFIGGEKVTMNNPSDGVKHGVGVIYQEYSLAKDLTVAENIFINNLTTDKKFVNWKTLRQRAKDLLEKLNFGDIDPMEIVHDLSIAYQQVVEICKALSRNTSILVLDEPTALLSNKEVEKLFELLLSLREQGVSIIYISHRLEEVFRIADRITVLKDGQYVGTVNKSDVTKQQLVGMMIGRDLKDYFPPRNAKIGDVVFEVKNVNNGRQTQDISFSVRAGEVLGVNGLVGSGRTETMHTIYGIDHMESGSIFFEGKKVTIRNPYQAIKNRIGYLSEDRKNSGVFLLQSIRNNITVSALDKFTGFINWINKREETKFVEDMAKDFTIKYDSIEDEAASLSGGNQQKVAIAKVLAGECKVVILDEPTRGVDVGSKREIYRIINKLAEEGHAIVMISSEMEEIIGMCDRAIVMHEGKITGELEKSELSEQNLIHYAMEV